MLCLQTSPHNVGLIMFCLERDFAARQIVGTRKRQEDYYAFSEFVDDPNIGSGVLLVLADGMGGHFGGSLASRRATQVFVETFRREHGGLVARMRSALNKANESLVAPDDGIVPDDDPAVTFMGTTLVAIALFEGALRWISVGDSPAFLFRNGDLRRLNDDHSFRPVIEEEVAAGNLSVHEALVHPDRHTLRSALTGYPMDLIDCPEEGIRVEEGDIILCATDGIFSLDEPGMVDVLKGYTGATASGLVMELLEVIEKKQHRFQDNTTVAVMTADAFLKP